MLGGLSLDQLRVFVAAAEQGSFSAAGRMLGRAQSVISQTIAALEARLGVALFDRTNRSPRLTEAGRALLADAAAIIGSTDAFLVRGRGMAAGLEAELSVVMDVMLPMTVLTDAARAFVSQFPAVPLRLYVEALGAVAQPVLDGRCQLGVIGTLPVIPAELARERLLSFRLVTVAAPSHPLAGHAGPIPTEILAQHVQLVLTDRSELSRGRDFGVVSPRVWRLADLGAKHAFLCAGLGWGGMPASAVERDIADGRLVALHLQDAPLRNAELPMFAIYRAAAPPGPAGRWLLGYSAKACADQPASRAISKARP